MTARREVSAHMAAAGIAARGRVGLTGISRTAGYMPRHSAPAGVGGTTGDGPGLGWNVEPPDSDVPAQTSPTGRTE